MNDQAQTSSTAAPKRRRWKRWLKIGVPVAVLLYLLGGFVGVPVVIQKLIIPKVGERLNGSITLDKARCNPLLLSLTLEGLSINDEADQRLLGFDRFHGDLQASSIFRKGFIFKTIEVDRPFGEATLLEDGKINLVQLIKPAENPKPKSDKPIELPHLRIANIAITDGHLGFFDQALGVEPFEFVIDPLSFNMEDLDTRPENENPHRFEATTDLGEKVSWEGTFFLNPLTSAGRFTLEGLDLSRYRPYFGRFTKLQLTSGTVGLDVSYDLAPVGDTPVAALNLASLTVDAIQVSQGDTAIIDGVGVEVEGVQVDAVQRNLVAQRVATRDGKLLVERDAEGNLIVMESLLVVPETPPSDEGASVSQTTVAEAPAQAPSNKVPSADPNAALTPWARVAEGLQKIVLDAVQGWEVELVRGEVINYALRITDASTPTPAELGVEEVNLLVGPVKSAEGYVVPFEASLKQLSPAAGTVEAAGRVGVEALTAEVTELTIQALDLSVAAPYAAMFLPEADVQSGLVDVTGTATADVSDPEKPKAIFNGEVRLSELLVEGPIEGEPLLGYQQVEVSGIAFDHDAATVNVAKIQGEGLHASAAVPIVADEPEASEGESQTTSAEPAEAAAADSGEYQPLTIPLPYAVRVEEHTQNDVRLFVLGTGVEPEVRLVIDQIELDYSGFDTAKDAAPGTLKLSASPSGGQFSATGTVVPDFEDLNHSDVDLEVQLDDLSLTAFSGISGRYVGRTIGSGGFFLPPFDVNVQDYQLSMSPKFKIKEFEFGEKVDSPDKIPLPIELAVAILKNPVTGEIASLGSVPISGPLNEPSVSIGGMILNALDDLVTGIVAAPFNLLAGALEGGEDIDPATLSHVVFADGQATLSEDSKQRLDLLGQILTKRPELAVVLHSLSLDERDQEGLIREAFLDLVREKTLPTLPNDHPARQNPKLIQLTEAQYQASIFAAYASLADPESETPGQLVVPPLMLPETEEASRKVRRGGSARGGGVPNVPRRNKPDADAETSTESAEGSDAPSIPFDQAEAEVLAKLSLPDDAVGQLEQQRLAAVQAYFADSTSIEPSRVIPAPDDTDGPPAAILNGLPDEPTVCFTMDSAPGG